MVSDRHKRAAPEPAGPGRGLGDRFPSAEANKRIVRRLWDEVWNRADLAVADAIFDESYAAHEKAFVSIIWAAFRTPTTRSKT